VPHGSFHAFGLEIGAAAAAAVRAGWQETRGDKRERCESRHAVTRLHEHPRRACGCDAHPERDGVNKPALPRHWISTTEVGYILPIYQIKLKICFCLCAATEKRRGNQGDSAK